MTQKGLGRWAQIARELKRRYLRRLLFRFGSCNKIAEHLGISKEHANVLLHDHGLMGKKRVKVQKTRAPEVQVRDERPKRAWFGTEISL